MLLKPGQNKKGQKIFQLHRFWNTFLQLAAEKKYSKNGATGKFFGPSYFMMALVGKKGLIFSGKYHTKSATVHRCPQRPPRLPLAVPFSISRFHARSLCKCATTRNALLSVLKKTARPLKSGRLLQILLVEKHP